MPASLARLAPAAIFSASATFVVLEGAAMHLYPGGTWWDPHARGHRFWENFLCDLEWRVALNGEPNPLGSRVALAAMLVLVAGLAAFWTVVPSLFAMAPAGRTSTSASASASGPASFPVRFARRAVPALGLLSAAAAVAVVFMPSERFGAIHALLVAVAGAPGLAATLLAVATLAMGEPRPRVAAWLGGATMIVSAIDYALYVTHVVAGEDGTPLLPAVQKMALGLLLAWMNTVALRVAVLTLRSRAASSRAHD